MFPCSSRLRARIQAVYGLCVYGKRRSCRREVERGEYISSLCGEVEVQEVLREQFLGLRCCRHLIGRISRFLLEYWEKRKRTMMKY